MEREYTFSGGYRIRATQFGSARYGPCEVCGQRCDTVYIASEVEGAEGMFGHFECLRAETASRGEADGS